MRYSIYIILPVLLSGCINQTSVQRSYERESVSCQAYAESRIAEFAAPDRTSDLKSRNAELVTLFSDCMAKEGWQVATPKRATESSSTSPAAISPQQPAPSIAPQPQQPVATQATPIAPSQPAPPLHQTGNPGAATYQPAVPVETLTPNYGSGPGRSF